MWKNERRINNETLSWFDASSCYSIVFFIFGKYCDFIKDRKKGYNNSLFLKVSGLSVFFLKKRVIYKAITVLIYLVFFATLALSYLDGIEFSFLKDLLIKTDFAIIPVLIIVNYIYSRKWFCINICESWIINIYWKLWTMNMSFSYIMGMQSLVMEFL